jgi:thiol-disulfide isomerase/thioredoxin
MASRSVILVVLAAALMLATSVSAAELRPFDAKSPEAIRAANAGKPFVLAFWSVYCEPCREEMALWKSMRHKYPEVPVILVATDPPEERAMVEKFLARFSPGPVQTWTFADDFAERVRFAVDRSWRGELPRTYFFDASHRPLARSGIPDRAWVEDWFSRQATNRGR